MQILVSNLNLEIIQEKFPLVLEQYEYVYFNPWGFSRLGIESQLEVAICHLELVDVNSIVVCLKPYFFGNRSFIAFKKLSLLAPNIPIQFYKSKEELFLFFNNSAI